MQSHNKATTEARTASMLQRVSVILAVTAASYGLALHAQPQSHKTGVHHQQQQAARG